MEKYLNGEALDRARDPRGPAQGDHRLQVPPGLLRVGAKVRRRAAAAGRRHRLPAQPDGHDRPSRATTPRTPTRIDRCATRTRTSRSAAWRSRSSDDQHGDADVRPRLLAARSRRARRVLNANTEQAREHQPDVPDARQRPQPDRRRRGRRHRRRASASKEAITGDTLCDPDDPIILEKPTFPEPVISMSIEPKTAADKQKLGEALTKLDARGPDVPGQLRRGDRPDDHRRHGRVAPGNPADAADARPQGGRDRRQAEGGVQGDDQQEGDRHPRQAPEAVRRPRSVRRLHDQHRAVRRHRPATASRWRPRT